MKEDFKKQIEYSVLFFLVFLILIALSWGHPNICNTMTAVGTLMVSISIFFTYDQLRVSKNIAISDFVAKIDEEFYSSELLKIRKHTAKLDFLNYEKARDCEDLLDFFEKIACLEKEGVINLNIVDAMWGYWIQRYWLLCKEHVYEMRIKENDNRYYEPLEDLCGDLALLGIRKAKIVKARIENPKVIEYYKVISEKLNEFKKDESEL